MLHGNTYHQFNPSLSLNLIILYNTANASYNSSTLHNTTDVNYTSTTLPNTTDVNYTSATLHTTNASYNDLRHST